MPFNPKEEYTIVPKDYNIEDFFKYKEDFVTRPPYQRKSVWSKKKKQALMDSLFRRYYVPRLVIREVRLSNSEVKYEIIDGQQRITAVQEFFNNEYPLSKSLNDIDNNLNGKYYKDLNSDIRKYIDKSIKYQADIIKNIEDPQNIEHQIIATTIFQRLQEGESLNFMEVAHAQLSSLTRNFIVKYADDQTFDFVTYKPIDLNPDKLPFFKLIDNDNIRMQHLQYMAQFLILETADGYDDIGTKRIEKFINDAKEADGIGNINYENCKEALSVIKTLNLFFEIFKNDPILDDKNGIKEFSKEYFVISVYLLIRHLRKYYVIDIKIKAAIKEFVYDFHKKWKQFVSSQNPDDFDLLNFCNSRQQAASDVETRDIIIRQRFFQHIINQSIDLIEKDTKRNFSELQKIIIYRKYKGICQQCVKEGIPENEAKVSWSKFQADHIYPHSLGGRTIIDNGELLCERHNKSKGAKIIN
jgi:hypothetical protein